MSDIELVIKIPENNYNQIKSTEDFYLSVEERLIKYGTPIPDNATNGDVIKAIFPNGITIDRSTAHAKQVTEDWLNAPYQKGGKE